MTTPGGPDAGTGTLRSPSLRRLVLGLAAAGVIAAVVPRLLRDAAKRAPDIVLVRTPDEVVARMLELADVKRGDVVYDLGCGDGRIVVAAARERGARGVGMDIDAGLVLESRENARKNGVQDLVTIKQADIFEADLSEATVVTMYLLPELNVRLMPRLKQLRPGTRIVSHEFGMKGAKPKEVATVHLGDGRKDHTLYLWVVPWADE